MFITINQYDQYYRVHNSYCSYLLFTKTGKAVWRPFWLHFLLDYVCSTITFKGSDLHFWSQAIIIIIYYYYFYYLFIIYYFLLLLGQFYSALLAGCSKCTGMSLGYKSSSYMKVMMSGQGHRSNIAQPGGQRDLVVGKMTQVQILAVK